MPATIACLDTADISSLDSARFEERSLEMIVLLNIVLMAQIAGDLQYDMDGTIRPRITRCTTRCSVILTPSGSDDTATIQAALDNPAFS